MVNASNIQEKALNGLKSSFKTLGEDTQANIKYYQDFATAMQKVTTTGDEQILMLVTLAANMGVAQNQREEAVKGAIGLATAFTNAGLSQETALKGIAQAYEGNFSMLGRYITTIQNASSEAEKMTIMQQLMANGFTMAKDEVNTGAGALQQYQNLVGDLKEHLGDLLKSICLPIVKILGVIASYLNEHQILFKALAGTIFIYSAAMAQSYIVKIKNIIALGALNTQSAALAIVQGVLTIKTKTVAAAQWLWNNAVLAHPIIAFLASLAILTAALIRYHKATKEAEKAQQQLNDTIKSNIRAATEQTKNNLNAQFKAQMENYELRIKNGENLYEQLKTYAKDYQSWLLNEYGKDSTEYQQYLFDKAEKHKNYLAEIEALERENAEKTWEFRNRELALKNEDEANLQRQIKAINDYYQENEELLINAGIAQKDIEKQQKAEIVKLKDEHYKTLLDKEKQLLKDKTQALFDFENSLQTLENPEQAQWERERQAIETKYAEKRTILLQYGKDEEEIKKAQITELAALDKEYYQKQKDKKYQDFKEEIAFAQKKKQLGLLNSNELSTLINAYFNFVASTYKKDAHEFIEALEMKKNAQKQHTQQLIADFNESWHRAQKLYSYKMFDRSQLDNYFAETKKVLIEQQHFLAQERQNLGENSQEYIALKQQIEELNITLCETEKQMRNLPTASQIVKNDFDDLLDNISQKCGLMGDAFKNVNKMLVDGFCNAVGQAIWEMKNFSQTMVALGKQMVSMLIAELMKLMIMKMILAPFTGGASLAFNEGGIVKKARGGYIAGPGTATSDSIPALLSNGEYVINAQKTSIFKPLLDLINYSPINKINAVLKNMTIPDIKMPELPKFAYASGGYVNSGTISFTTMENKFEQMLQKLANIEEKDMNVIINSRIRGVEFHKEILKAKNEYERKIQ